MATILVYNNYSNNMEIYQQAESDPMPYSTGRTLLVREFRGSSDSSVLWTDVRTMEAWNATRNAWGRNIYVGFAFKRIWEGGHGYQSQHYAGVALDLAQTATPEERNELRNLASRLGVWVYVEPAYLTPTWVHVDRRLGPPACPAGYPLVRRGSVNQYVLVFKMPLMPLDTPAQDWMAYLAGVPREH